MHRFHASTITIISSDANMKKLLVNNSMNINTTPFNGTPPKRLPRHLSATCLHENKDSVLTVVHVCRSISHSPSLIVLIIWQYAGVVVAGDGAHPLHLHRLVGVAQRNDGERGHRSRILRLQRHRRKALWQERWRGGEKVSVWIRVYVGAKGCCGCSSRRLLSVQNVAAGFIDFLPFRVQ